MRDVRVFPCPESFVPWVPPSDPAWSAFQRLTDEGATYSETGLRRQLNRAMAAAQPGAGPQVAIPMSDDPERLTWQYVAAIRASVVGQYYTTRLSGTQVESDFKLDGWWVNHQSHCEACRAYGDWEFAREHNEENPCYFSHLLASLFHGFLLPFKSFPSPQRMANYESLDLSPLAAATEWSKMKQNRVLETDGVALQRLRERFPGAPFQQLQTVTPLLSVVKPNDIDEALAELHQRHHADDLEEPIAEDRTEEEQQGYVDRINAALSALGSARQVKARVCHDYSKTLNPHLEDVPLSFHPVDEFLEIVKPQSWICKVDYKRCFHNIPLHPAMYPFMGMEMEGELLVAVRVVFGIKTGPYICCMCTSETAKAAQARGASVKIFMDDNGVAGDTQQKCYEGQATMVATATAAGWPISEDKLEEDKPAQRLAYRGVTFDTVAGTLSIHPSRLVSNLRKVRQLVDAEPSMAHEVRVIRSTLGSLEWVCCCVPVGRLYTKRVYGSLPFVGKSTGGRRKRAPNHYKAILKPEAREDLLWWKGFLEAAVADKTLVRWAGFDMPLPQCPVVRLFSDASGDIGFGGIAHGEVVAGLWTKQGDFASRSSSWKEWVGVYTLLLSVGPRLAPGTIVVVTTDNQGNAFALNNGAACEGSFGMLQAILLLADQLNVRIVADWINRERFPLIDTLSRLDPMPGSR